MPRQYVIAIGSPAVFEGPTRRDGRDTPLRGVRRRPPRLSEILMIPHRPPTGEKVPGGRMRGRGPTGEKVPGGQMRGRGLLPFGPRNSRPRGGLADNDVVKVRRDLEMVLLECR